MDTNRIALYLCGHLPPYYKPFDKGEFLDLMRGAASGLFTVEELNFLNTQSNGDKQQFYSMCLHKLQKANEFDFLRIIELINVPDDVIGIVQDKIIPKISDITVGDNYKEVQNELARYKKPIILTEGKTDVVILKTAWEKLYPDEVMPFDIKENGIEPDDVNDKPNGNAEGLRRQLEYSSVISEFKTIIGIFDNDLEGNNNFYSLNENLFGKSDDTDFCKNHLTKSVYAMILPVPENRNDYVKKRGNRYLCIEHYFSDDILIEHKMKGEPIGDSSLIFKIAGNKNYFSKVISTLDKSEFINFGILFNKIKEVMNIKNY